MSDDLKPKLGARAPLGVKRTTEGRVQQQFSHGRKNTVVVEHKKRRVLTRPGEAAPAEAVTVEPTPAPTAPSPPPAAPAPSRPSAAEDVTSRRERQDRLLREAEEARMTALEDVRRREDEAKRSATEEEARRAEDNRRAGEDTPGEAEAALADAAPTPAADETAADASPRLDPDRPAPRSFTPIERPKRPEKKDDKPRGPGRDRGERKDRGKLTVNRAFSDEGDARSRSLAALKRSREKEKRHQQAGGVQAKKVIDVIVPEAITVQELAKRMEEKGAALVKSLFKMGVVVTLTQTIDQDTAELLVTEFGHTIKRVSEADVDIASDADVDAPETLQPRPPVVTIMGHVDHGKTSLLDALRGTDVVAGESGGITQHIGAYQVAMKDGRKITFLDTPGHEAFTEMRARGANVTDIVVIVVAADDGLMPQTIEAIHHTKAAGVPMIIAINKIDKEEANPQKIRERLLEHEVIVEEMSGDVLDAEVSAKTGAGLDALIEKIQLQAELLELRANPDRPAEGNVIEAKLDKGRGPVATVLIKRGTLRNGDIFVVGAESGKVRAMVDDKGKPIKAAGPAVPVEVLGLSGVPAAGDQLTVVENEGRAREVAAYRQEVLDRKRTTSAPTSVEHMFTAMAEKQAIEYPVVVKGDVQGSVEAIVGALNRISTDDIKLRVLHAGAGGITESDVTLASASKAPIIGFNVRANAKAREVATREGVRMLFHDVIYALTDEIRAEMAGQLGPERIETVVGRADIKEVFSAGKHGKAAGLLVTEGYIRQALKARVMRDDVIIYNGQIASLRRFKDDVPEVRAGLECGITLEATTDIKAGDIVETYEVEERERTL